MIIIEVKIKIKQILLIYYNKYQLFAYTLDNKTYKFKSRLKDVFVKNIMNVYRCIYKNRVNFEGICNLR